MEVRVKKRNLADYELHFVAWEKIAVAAASVGDLDSLKPNRLYVFKSLLVDHTVSYFALV